MTSTPENLAIKQWLSKPRPSSGPCGCMGPRTLDPSMNDRPIVHVVRITDIGRNRLKVVSVIRRYTNMNAEESAKLLRSDSCTLEFNWLLPTKLMTELRDYGVKYEYTNNKPPMYPLCPCGMRYVEEVDGKFYRITEHIGEDGSHFTAKCIGPRGGPYNLN